MFLKLVSFSFCFTASRNSKQIEPAAGSANNDNPASDLRNMRRIIAEDPEWSLATVPLLTDLCIKHIVHNFESE